MGMKAVVQRVKDARVRIGGNQVAGIGRGLMVLLGVAAGDGADDAAWLAGKLARLRIFADEDRLMNLSVTDVGGEVLVVSQFTLLGDVRKGNRPGFSGAAEPDIAENLYLEVVKLLKEDGVPVQTGVFGAVMDVELVNEGPVTLILESRER
jgi:D-tyrosyl-tRNA(Tyr) deacylase